ncbi:MAG: aldehyde dehydrogenase family protein [Candidatus Thermoplasmatota archaeon]|nr:aldehyde dehydrogenase family protein [Candidatus Thermoplasmatota archaeon]MCL5252964.1 aldehyde dehydrogenase family protein [Candidatus Thermoplasmatota archaeon]
MVDGNKLKMSRMRSTSLVGVVNPATGREFANVALMTKDKTKKAIENASEAKEELNSMSMSKRMMVLKNVADLITQSQDELAKLLSGETGKPVKDSRVEIMRARNVFTYCAEEAKLVLEGKIPNIDAYEYPVGNEERIVMITREPVGVVAAILPFNFPASSFAHKVGPSFISGNSTVVKPSLLAPLSAIRLAELFEKAGAPKNSVITITGKSDEIGNTIIDHPEIRLITFTGSTETGLKIASRAAANSKRTVMELGGSDAAIVLRDADLKSVTKILVRGRFDYAGQNCNSTKRIFIHESLAEKFTRLFVELTSKIIVGDPLNEDTEMGPVISEESIVSARSVVDDALENGAKLLFGGSRIKRDGYYFSPTVLGNVPEKSIALRDEVFAPIAPIAAFTDEDSAIAAANSAPYGLQAAIFSSDMKRAMKLARSIKAGAVMLNDSTRLRWDVLPFGGVKETGFGREGVRDSLLEMTEQKLISLNLSD